MLEALQKPALIYKNVPRDVYDEDQLGTHFEIRRAFGPMAC